MSTANLHVIVGLGATGLSCARYLKQSGIPIAVTDTREKPPHLEALLADFPDVAVSLGGLDASLLAKAATIILSPGISLREPLIAEQKERGIPVLGDIELFARAVKAPVIAITGTNAKSTVTTLVGKMAQAAGYQTQIGGNLGVPALELLLQNKQADLFVLELSSFQLETTFSLQANVASVLNVTPDHMDRYQSLKEYQQTKLRIYQHCQTAVSNRDDPLTTCDYPVSNQLTFTLNKPRHNEFGIVIENGLPHLAFEDKALLAVSDLPVMGKHYQANTLSALAIGHAFGLPFTPMLKVLREFTGLSHRCEFVRELDHIKWINDSKGTNVGATYAAIEGLGTEIKGKLVLIAGGVGKNADFNPLLPVIKNYVRHVVLIGEAAPIFADLLKEQVEFSMAASIKDAVQIARLKAESGDSVLLSPACASFDMFNNFEHRGRVFAEIVNQL